MTIRVEVDFNSRDDLGRVPASAEGMHLHGGQVVDAFDDEGNRCLAHVSEVVQGWAYLAPIWDTFADDETSRMLPASAEQFSRILNQLSFEVAAVLSPTHRPGEPLQGSSILT